MILSAISGQFFAGYAAHALLLTILTKLMMPASKEAGIIREEKGASMVDLRSLHISEQTWQEQGDLRNIGGENQGRQPCAKEHDQRGLHNLI